MYSLITLTIKDYVLIALSILMVIGIIFIVILFNHKCPECGRYWARERIDRKVTYSTVYYDGRNYQYFSSAHDQKGKIQEVETNYYKCTYCRHKWEKVSKTNKEKD